MINVKQVDAADHLAMCHAIRRQVFIFEQSVPETEEVDGRDPDCLQFLAFANHVAIATARILPKGKTAKIQRVAVLKEHRGTGIGRQLMAILLRQAKSAGFENAELGAQMHAIRFYESLGFSPFGPEYLDAGIAHRDMRRML